MTKDQVLAAAKKYEDLLYASPPERADTALICRFDGGLCKSDVLGHVRWMCLEIPNLVKGDRLPKAERWLGFIQGVLWAHGFESIDAFKNDNRST